MECKMQNGKHVILLVDDDPDILESLRIVLEANDYVVATAGSAEEGLLVFGETSPDLLIVDLMMEEIDSGANFVRLKASSTLGGDYAWTMPTSQGTNGEALMIDAAGNMIWGTPTGAGPLYGTRPAGRLWL